MAGVRGVGGEECHLRAFGLQRDGAIRGHPGELARCEYLPRRLPVEALRLIGSDTALTENIETG